MTPILASVIISPWISLPFAGVMMLLVAAHIEVTSSPAVPRSRRRIRIANAWVMMVTIPLLAAGSSLIDPDTRAWVFSVVWLAASWLVALSVVLAMADIANTVRLTRTGRRQLRAHLREMGEELGRIQQERAARAPAATDDHPTP